MTQQGNAKYAASITLDGEWEWTSADTPPLTPKGSPVFVPGDTLKLSQKGTMGEHGICLKEETNTQRSPFTEPHHKKSIFLYDSDSTIFTFSMPKLGVMTNWSFDIEGPLLDLIDPEFHVGPGSTGDTP